MTDVVFELRGDRLPADYAFGLWDEIVRCVPALAEDALTGVHPLRLAAGTEECLLPKRAKLVVRASAGLVLQALRLSGARLQVGGEALEVGRAVERELTHFSTLQAHLVVGAGDEQAFLEEIDVVMNARGIAAKRICGKRMAIGDPTRGLSGYALVLHELKPEASLALQYEGLGAGRCYGCGIFVPHKVIAGID
ncbi:MAG: type I-MYXAN CRISPR-associated protein Cas6/Cmx6 [Pseudomonadota bacterium]